MVKITIWFESEYLYSEGGRVFGSFPSLETENERLGL